jgi:predicted Zn-dependent protease
MKTKLRQALGKMVCALVLLCAGLMLLGIVQGKDKGAGLGEGCGSAASLLTEADAERVVVASQQEAPAIQVARWARMTLVTNPRLRAEAVRNLPPAYAALRVNDPAISSALAEVLQPLLCLYGKQYELFIIRHRVPLIEADSHTVLVLTTGFLAEVESDDELLTCVAHELAHEIFRARSDAARQAYAEQMAGGNRDSVEAAGALRELALIELECDAVAARTIAYLHYNPTAFPKLLERIRRHFPKETEQGAEMGENIHPTECLRAHVIVALAGDWARVSPQASQPLKRIKLALRPDQTGGATGEAR